MSKPRTWWHLGGAGRKPSAYDIVTSRLLYHPERGFEVRTPGGEWYERYTSGSRLRTSDWERFRDPRETTYASWVERARTSEAFVDGLLASLEAELPPRAAGGDWLQRAERYVAPLRYPLHGLQMAAAYVAGMAPCGRIAVAALFQTGDELRRVQRLVYWSCAVARHRAGFGAVARATWEDGPAWQPLRETVERLLVTYDWGEALVALGLVVKPMVDELVTVEMARLALDAGDDVLARMLGSFAEDARWQQAWCASLVRMLLEEAGAGGNAEAVDEWVDRWSPRARAAVGALAEALDPASAAARAGRIDAAWRSFQRTFDPRA